jgi:hypothetical protein
MASSRFSASITRSAQLLACFGEGSSVTTRLPFVALTVVAVDVGWSGAPPRNFRSGELLHVGRAFRHEPCCSASPRLARPFRQDR